MGSVFICNILYMGCISSVLISRKIDSCFPGAPASLRPCVPASLRPCVPASLRPCVLACGTFSVNGDELCCEVPTSPSIPWSFKCRGGYQAQ